MAFERIQDHVAATDVPYTPVLLHQPLDRPEDAKKPLITPLPPPPMGHIVQASPQPKKNKRQKQPNPNPNPNQRPTPSPVAQVQAQVAHAHAPVVAHGGEPVVTVDSLFSKFVSPPPSASTSPPPPAGSTELRGPALLQTMFASAAASGGVGGLFATSTSTSETKTITSAGGEKETVSTEKVVTSTSVSLPPDVSTTTTTTQVVGQGKEDGDGEEGVAQGNMLKQLLGISSVPSSSNSASPRPPSPPNGQSLHATPSGGVPSRSGSIPPTFTPINEDEEGTPPRVHTPPNTDAFGAVKINVSTTPTPQSKRRNGGVVQPATPNINRDLVAYDFEGEGAPQGIVSPWAPLQQSQARTDVPPQPSPSPSMLPKPRAVREKRGGGAGGRNNGSRRDGSPVANRPQHHQRQPSTTASASNNAVALGTPKKTYVPRNDATEEVARRIDRDVAADVLVGVMKDGGEDGPLKAGLSKETFVQELLALIHVSCWNFL